MKNMQSTASVVEDKEKKKISRRIGEFFGKNHALFFAPAIVLCLYLVGLIQYGVYPFGEYTAASYDLSAQICPFIEHLFDVLQGKSSLTYSYAIVGGADVTGTFLYFFISPFSFLFLIFGDGKAAYASSIVMACKLMAVAAAGAWFAKKQFKGIPDYLCIGVGVVYTYCGYMFVANTYINWVDFLIYMPFCVAAFRRFVKTGSIWLFSALMACCIYTCFSIACFSMFTVFPALIVYGLLCVKKEGRIKFIAYLCLSFAVAVIMALPVLLPALAAYLRGGRSGDGGIFENFWYGFSTLSEGKPSDFDSSSFLSTWSDSMYAKWSYILSDSVFFILTLVWFWRKGLKDPFAKFMLITGVFTLLPTVVDEAMNLMNMGSYMSYALRFGFLNALYFLGGGCLCMENLCYKQAHAFDGTPLYVNVSKDAEEVKEEGRYALNPDSATLTKPKKSKAYYVWASVILVLGVAALVFLIWYISGHYRPFLAGFTKDVEKALENLEGFAGSYAHSLGGLEVIMFPFFIVVIVGLFGAWLVGSKKISPRLLSFVLIAIVSVQVVFYNNQLVVGNRSDQHKNMGAYQTLCTELDKEDDSYFRVKDYSDKLTACAPFTTGGNSFSVFSSVIDADNFIPYNLFGYKGNGQNSFKSAHDDGKSNRAEAFGDSFLGYKYFIVPEADKAEAEEKSYLQPVLTESGTQLTKDGFYVYENTICFPSAYRVDGGIFRFAGKNNASNRKKNQEALYTFLRGEKLTNAVVTEKDVAELSEYLWDKAAEVEVGSGKITARVTAEAGEYLFLNFVASKGYAVTVNGKKADLAENDLKFLSVALEEGENEVVFTYRSPYVIYMAIGAGAALLLLCAAALVLKKARVAEYCAPVIAWVGIALAAAVVAFFMIYPTGAFLAKLIELAKGVFLK